MTAYLTEQEQIELLKNWIKQYSTAIIVGVVLAICIIFGWRYLDERHTKLETHASMLFDDMLTARAQHNDALVMQTTDKLLTHYPKTIYAAFASLMLARQAILEGNYQGAEKQLRAVMKQCAVPAIREIARLRLASVLIETQSPKESIALLKKIDDPAFTGRANEIKGDAALAMDDKTNARKWYHQALETLPNADVTRPLLQMKYDNLAA